VIAKGSGEWGSLGPKWDLPVKVPEDPNALTNDGSETLRLTAWQYTKKRPGTDIAARKEFSVALNEHDA
jgi:hypothetical protein